MREKLNHRSNRNWLTCSLGFVLLGLLAGCGGADLGVLHPDTILFNGKIVTVDEDFSIAEAVAIKDGRFVAVGSNDSGDSITLVSSNGTDWKESGNSLQKAILNSIAHGKGTFVVAGSHFDKDGGFVGLLASSSNLASEWAVSHETKGAMILIKSLLMCG